VCIYRVFQGLGCVYGVYIECLSLDCVYGVYMGFRGEGVRV
jgi:hypothetical protein